MISDTFFYNFQGRHEDRLWLPWSFISTHLHRFKVGMRSSQCSSYYISCWNFLFNWELWLNYIFHEAVGNFCLVPAMSPGPHRLMVPTRYSVKLCWMNERLIFSSWNFRYDGEVDKHLWFMLCNYKIHKWSHEFELIGYQILAYHPHQYEMKST